MERSADRFCRRTAQGRRTGGRTGCIGHEATRGSVRRGAVRAGAPVGSRGQRVNRRFAAGSAEVSDVFRTASVGLENRGRICLVFSLTDVWSKGARGRMRSPLHELRENFGVELREECLVKAL